MSLDEATTGLLARLAESGAKPLHEMAPHEARGMGQMLREMYGPGPEVLRVCDNRVRAADGALVTARVFSPSDSANAVIVYYHGGGWVMGAIDEFDTLARQLAVRTNSVVVIADYRLAPEYRYPTAVEDAWTILCWAGQRREELAGSRVPLIVAGDSAGGNLAAVIAQRARAQGGPRIAVQVLIYPVTDAAFDTPSYRDPENQLMVTRDTMAWFWDHYAPDQFSRGNVDASPLRAEEFFGLPPAVVLTAEHDVLRDEGEAYVRGLRAAGVPVDHQRFEGQMHGFFTLVNVLPGAAAGMTFVAERLNQRVATLTTEDW